MAAESGLNAFFISYSSYNYLFSHMKILKQG